MENGDKDQEGAPKLKGGQTTTFAGGTWQTSTHPVAFTL